MKGSHRRVVEVAPDVVFALLVDPYLLPTWNRQIRRVVEAPEVLEPGTEWVVEMSALGRRWPSRSRVETLDHPGRRFVHRSQTDDGNPSYAVWSWAVDEHRGGSEVTVSWQLNPKTFWRRALLGRIRQHQLMRTEVSRSLDTIADSVEGSRVRD